MLLLVSPNVYTQNVQKEDMLVHMIGYFSLTTFEALCS